MTALSPTEKLSARDLDQDTVAFYLRINPDQIVILQALIESYEGLGSVRTIDIERSLIAIIMPRDQVDDCQRLLRSLQKEIPYQCVADEITDAQISETA